MNCPGCGTAASTVYKTQDDGVTTSRQRRCKCGGRWYTDEKVRRGSFVVIPVPLVTEKRPLVTSNGTPVTATHKSDLVSVSSPEPLSNPDQTPARVSEPAAPPPVFRGMPLAAKGQTWDVSVQVDARLAEAFPAIDRPAEYAKAKVWLFASAKNRKTASGMERFLFHWFTTEQNRGGARAALPKDTRCAFHRAFGTRGKRPPAGWFADCSECKHARAGGELRTSEPTPAIDLVAATEAKLARERAVTPASPEQLAELRSARGAS